MKLIHEKYYSLRHCEDQYMKWKQMLYFHEQFVNEYIDDFSAIMDILFFKEEKENITLKYWSRIYTNTFPRRYYSYSVWNSHLVAHIHLLNGRHLMWSTPLLYSCMIHLMMIQYLSSTNLMWWITFLKSLSYSS
jgi:hypothetical protein